MLSRKLCSYLKSLKWEHLVSPVSGDRGEDGGELQDVQGLATLNGDQAIFGKYCSKSKLSSILWDCQYSIIMLRLGFAKLLVMFNNGLRTREIHIYLEQNRTYSVQIENDWTLPHYTETGQGMLRNCQALSPNLLSPTQFKEPTSPRGIDGKH